MEEKHQVALENLIFVVINSIVLTYPDFSKDFLIYVDASKDGLGCFLYQQQQYRLKLIGYASRTLVGTEKRYHSSKLEDLSLKWAIRDRFKSCPYNVKHCDVFTGNNLLSSAMLEAKLNATGQRWASELCDYPITIHYK